MNASPVLVCPADHQSLRVTGGRAECALCGSVYMRVGQIWRFVRANERTAAFLDAYRAVRRGEGWGAIDPHYYRHLPLVGPADPQRETWRVRSASFSALLRVIGQRRHVLDLGAGNGWLAYQLLRRGHSVAPVDLSADEYDGLGALGNYPIPFDAYQADFASLPFGAAQFDLVIFNASLHYAWDLPATVAEALRVLAVGGRLVVMDSPLYHAPASGRAMLAEKKRALDERFGVELPDGAKGYLTFADFEDLARTFVLNWRWTEPFVDLRWATRQWRARLRGRREPARFGLMLAKVATSSSRTCF